MIVRVLNTYKHPLIKVQPLYTAVVIGFDLESYTVSEGLDNFANITVKLLNGSLGQEEMVTVTTQDGSATGNIIIGHMYTEV